MNICTVENCRRPFLAKGLCRMHYLRNYKHGNISDPDIIRITAGDRFNSLVVISLKSSSPRKWLCRCDCGIETVVFGTNLTRGHTKSCGCKSHDGMRTHGLALSSEYRAWVNMHSRCYNPSTPGWDSYGGRGIIVCDRWSTFANFFADMGSKPQPEYSLDRVDVNGNYEPENCRWATTKTQARNTRGNRHVTLNGERLTLADAVEKSGLEYHCVLARLRRGWSDSDALTVPSAGRAKR